MKKIILFGLLLLPVFGFSQTIDSVAVTIGSPSSSVYIKGIRPQMELSGITLTALNDMNNTQVLNLYFKGCPLNQMVFPYDTVINLNVPFPFALEINSFHDTSVVCPYPSNPMLVDTFHLYSSEILGIGEQLNKGESVKVYPNPANNSMDVRAGVEIEEISVYSMEGNRLSEKVIGKKNFSVDLSDYSPGPYFLVLKTPSTDLVIKRIIKR